MSLPDTKTCESCGQTFSRIRSYGPVQAGRWARMTRCKRACGTNSSDLAALMLRERITYRQADYWIRSYPHLFSDRAKGSGTGCSRRYEASDLAVFTRMGRLTRAGLTVGAAARVAADPLNVVRLSDHVVVEVSVDSSAVTA